MKIAPHSTLLLTGDSITDAGRHYPLGQRDQENGLGSGYVSLVDALLATCHPEHPICVLNTGISGNRVPDLLLRWQPDVLAHQPDWVSVMIGINDVWRQFDSPALSQQVDLATYRQTLAALLEKTLPAVQGLVLLSPFFIEADPSDPMRKMVDQYGSVMRSLAESYAAQYAGKCQLLFVDVQAVFDRYLAIQSAQSLSSDRVHPNLRGHLLIAKAFAAAIGLRLGKHCKQVM